MSLDEALRPAAASAAKALRQATADMVAVANTMQPALREFYVACVEANELAEKRVRNRIGSLR